MGHFFVCQIVCKSFVWSPLSSPPTLTALPVPLLLPDLGPDKAALWSPPQRSNKSLILPDTEATPMFSLPDLRLYLTYASGVSMCVLVVLCCVRINLEK